MNNLARQDEAGHTPALTGDNHKIIIEKNMVRTMENVPNWSGLHTHKRHALQNIASKISSILTGDPNHLENWEDIIRYASMVADTIKAARSKS